MIFVLWWWQVPTESCMTSPTQQFWKHSKTQSLALLRSYCHELNFVRWSSWHAALRMCLFFRYYVNVFMCLLQADNLIGTNDNFRCIPHRQSHSSIRFYCHALSFVHWSTCQIIICMAQRWSHKGRKAFKLLRYIQHVYDRDCVMYSGQMSFSNSTCKGTAPHRIALHMGVASLRCVFAHGFGPGRFSVCSL